MSKKMQSNILLLITAIIWGSAFVAQKSGMDYIEPFTFNGIRTFIGGLVLIPVIMVMNKKSPEENLTKEEKSKNKKALLIGGICCGLALFAAYPGSQSFRKSIRSDRRLWSSRSLCLEKQSRVHDAD